MSELVTQFYMDRLDDIYTEGYQVTACVKVGEKNTLVAGIHSDTEIAPEEKKRLENLVGTKYEYNGVVYAVNFEYAPIIRPQ